MLSFLNDMVAVIIVVFLEIMPFIHVPHFILSRLENEGVTFLEVPFNLHFINFLKNNLFTLLKAV